MLTFLQIDWQMSPRIPHYKVILWISCPLKNPVLCNHKYLPENYLRNVWSKYWVFQRTWKFTVANGYLHLNYIWEWRIHYGSLSAIFTPLHSNTDQKNMSVIKVATMKNTMAPHTPVMKYPLPFSVKSLHESRTVWKALL